MSWIHAAAGITAWDAEGEASHGALAGWHEIRHTQTTAVPATGTTLTPATQSYISPGREGCREGIDVTLWPWL